MKQRIFNLFAGASFAAVAATAAPQAAFAQGADAGFELEEIVVTARRKDESIQDVPTTINAVTGADIEKLSIRTFADIATVVPGLAMAPSPSGVGGTASVRGVNYDVNASGNNGTVEFYLNDAPISAGNLFQTVYDIQQVELLRGPQGTLRGRASPSGSMTVTTRRPDLQEMGGYGSVTGTDIGGYSGQGAFGIPIISNMLAVRVAASYDQNEGSRVKSINSSIDTESKSKSGRVTVRFEPTDSLSFILTAQKTKQDVIDFAAVESQQEVNPNAAVNPGAPGGPGIPYIRAFDRLSVQDAPRVIEQEYNNYNFQAQWAFAGQKLNYVGARNEQRLKSRGDLSDFGNFFPSNYAAALQGYSQFTDTNPTATAHELRIANEARVFDMFDYIVGSFYQRGNFPTDLPQRPTVLLFGPPSPATGAAINNTVINRRGGNLERSVFANLTAQLGDATELSGGARYINYHSDGALIVNGVPDLRAAEDSTYNTWIYSASLKHNFTDDLMAYASFGTSWRPGLSVVGDFSLNKSPLERSFLILPPEKSKSYEVGFKASALDKRLRTAVSVFHQTFDNYPYRSASGVYFVETTNLGNPSATPPVPPTEGVPAPFNFVGAVPVEVNGVEAEVNFAPIAAWDMGVTATYSEGKVDNGLVPCTDYFPRDGAPDAGSTVPTVTDIRTATGGDNLSSCNVSYRASSAPLWSGVLQSEYRVPLTPAFNGFVRGLVSFYGDSQNDPSNSVDDYKGYELLNLYLGIRDPNGVWEVSLYGKNVTETERVLARSSSTLSSPYRVVAGPTPGAFNGATNYYGGSNVAGLTLTPPREFGLTLRYSFGSK